MNDGQGPFPGIMLGNVLTLTLIALIVVPLADLGLGFDKSTSAFIFGVLLFTGIAEVLIVRLIVLPSILAKPGTPQGAAVTTGYSVASAPAIYGLVVSIITGQGLLALPFAAVAIYGFVAIWAYLRESQARVG